MIENCENRSKSEQNLENNFYIEQCEEYYREQVGTYLQIVEFTWYTFYYNTYEEEIVISNIPRI